MATKWVQQKKKSREGKNAKLLLNFTALLYSNTTGEGLSNKLSFQVVLNRTAHRVLLCIDLSAVYL